MTKLNTKPALAEKNNTIRWTQILTVAIGLLLLGCSPQHHYAFQQFNTTNKAAILSIQGYVVDSAKANSLEKDWNLLVTKMSKKPGFISAFLSKGVGNSKLVLAHSKWQDLQSLRNAFSDEEILKLEAKLPKIQFEHLFDIGTLGSYPEKTQD